MKALLILLLFATTAWGQISVPAEVGEHQPIVVRSEQNADAYIWRVSEPAQRRMIENGLGIHVWAPPGKYKVELTTIRLEIDWEAQNSRLIYDEHVAAFEVKQSGPSPPPPGPGPDPVVNPYHPAPEFQAAVEPVRTFRLSESNSKTLAEMYHTVASQARAGVYRSLGEVRSDLVKRGTSLNLRGVYPGLAEIVDKYLTTSLGLEAAVSTGRVGDVLETLAWAVFEAGRTR